MTQVDIVQWIQRIHSPTLDTLMVAISSMGNDAMYLLTLPIIYWLLPKRVGIRLIAWVTLALYGSELLKMGFHTTRPIGHPGIRSLYTESAPGYSFPSGHTVGATMLWGYLAATYRNRWFAVLGAMAVGTVAFSRLYLGVHWPIDIAGGAAFGIFVVALACLADRWLNKQQLANHHPGRQTASVWLQAGVVVLLSVALYGFAYNSLQRQWVLFCASALMGYIVERNRLHIESIRSVWSMLAILLIGGSVLLTLQDIIPVYLAEQGFRHSESIVPALSGLWATLGAPLIFHQCGLAASEH